MEVSESIETNNIDTIVEGTGRGHNQFSVTGFRAGEAEHGEGASVSSSSSYDVSSLQFNNVNACTGLGVTESVVTAFGESKSFCHTKFSKETTDAFPRTKVCSGLETFESQDADYENKIGDDDVWNVLQLSQRVLRFPLCALTMYETNTVYLKTQDGTYKSVRPTLGSFMDWIFAMGDVMNRHVRDLESSSYCGCQTLRVVEDVHLHKDVFFVEEYVTGAPRLAFYADIPLVDKDSGEIIGMLHLMDRIARTLNENSVNLLSRFIVPKLVMEWSPLEGIEAYMKVFGSRDDQVHINRGKYLSEQRAERLTLLFDTLVEPLMIIGYQKGQSPSVDHCNISFKKYASPKLGLQGIMGNMSEDAKLEQIWSGERFFVPGVDEGVLFQFEPLFSVSKSDENSNNMKRMGSSRVQEMKMLCSMVVMSLDPLHQDDAKTNLKSSGARDYYMVTVIDREKICMYQELSSEVEATIPPAAICKGDCVSSQRFFDQYSCLYQGSRALLNVFKFHTMSRKIFEFVPEVVQSIMSLSHANILPQYDAVKVVTHDSAKMAQILLEQWVVEQVSDMGSLYDAICSGVFSVGEAKPLFVGLTLLDIARGIQHVHNLSLVYGDLNSMRIWIQSDPSDKIRGWKAVLGTPDIVINCQGRSRGKINEEAPYWHITNDGQVCAETLLGSKTSHWTEAYMLGILLWEMWHSSPTWPQFSNNERVDILCFGDKSLPKPMDMPRHLRSIFQGCISMNRDTRMTVETVITLLQNFVDMRLAGPPGPHDGMTANV
jgi:hypothetical protein